MKKYETAFIALTLKCEMFEARFIQDTCGKFNVYPYHILDEILDVVEICEREEKLNIDTFIPKMWEEIVYYTFDKVWKKIAFGNKEALKEQKEQIKRYIIEITKVNVEGINSIFYLNDKKIVTLDELWETITFTILSGTWK
jgi:hypothetical protein